MTERRQKRKFDIDETTDTMSQGILDILNEDFPMTYIVLQMAYHFKMNPIPTDISIYNQIVNDPDTLMRNLTAYVDFAINKFMGGDYSTILTGNFPKFCNYLKLLYPGPEKLSQQRGEIYMEQPNNNYSIMYIIPNNFKEYMPKIIPDEIYNQGVNNVYPYREMIISVLNKVFNSFCFEIKEKYNKDIHIQAEEGDLISIVFMIGK